MIQFTKHVSSHEGKIILSSRSALVKKISVSPISKDSSGSTPTKGFFCTIIITYDNNETIKLNLYAKTEAQLNIQMKNDFEDLKVEVRKSDSVLKVLTKEDEANKTLDVSFSSKIPEDLYMSPALVAVKNISVYPIQNNYGDLERWLMIEFENNNLVEYILIASRKIGNQ
jgi:hypothetical protein